MAIVRYMVNNVDQAVEFYTRQLGFVVEERWGPAFASVSRADLKLWLSGPQTSAAKPMPDGRVPQPGGWNRLVIEVEDIQATVSQLRES